MKRILSYVLSSAFVVTVPVVVHADEKTETTKKTHKNLDGSTTTETTTEHNNDNAAPGQTKKAKHVKKVTKKNDKDGSSDTKVETENKTEKAK